MIDGCDGRKGDGGRGRSTPKPKADKPGKRKPKTVKDGKERGREAAPVRNEAREMPKVKIVKAHDNDAESSVEGRPSFRGGSCGPLACSVYYKDCEDAASPKCCERAPREFC